MMALTQAITAAPFPRGGRPPPDPPCSVSPRGDDPPRPPRCFSRGDPSPRTPLGRDPSPQTPLGGARPPNPLLPRPLQPAGPGLPRTPLPVLPDAASGRTQPPARRRPLPRPAADEVGLIYP